MPYQLFANGGFFFVNLFSMLSPHGFSLATPSELKAYGWTTLDLLVAPIVTALHALFTHPEAQPFWKQANYSFNNLLKPANESLRPEGEPDHEMIRAVCAVGLTCAFAVRALKNFGPAFQEKNAPKVNSESVEGCRGCRDIDCVHSVGKARRLECTPLIEQSGGKGWNRYTRSNDLFRTI